MMDSIPRRHDLDALRASAMLLGIAFHAALSFAAGLPWLVQDKSRNLAFLLFEQACHGFRMPLFFLVSGFFTAMLWRRRGLRGLITQRFRRILLPCLLGLATLVPLMFVVAGLVMRPGVGRRGPSATEQSRTVVFDAIVADNPVELRRFLVEGAEVNGPHPEWGSPPLVVAAFLGRFEAARVLIEHGADLSARARDGATALHAAAFLGRAEVVRLLVQHGADLEARNQRGETPADVASTDWALTRMIAGMLQVPVEEASVRHGREQVRALLRGEDNLEVRVRDGADGQRGGSVVDGPRGLGSVVTWLYLVPVFHHLWFLWFLWWLVLLFSVGFLVAEWRGWRGAPGWLVLSPTRLLWLLPLTAVPQTVMGATSGGFGPDTSVGLLPMPHVFLYYAIFFGFGILYYEADDQEGRVGRGWRWLLPLTVLIVFPVGLELSTGVFGLSAPWRLGELQRPLSVLLQVLYAWLMTFACMGLFRSLLVQEHPTMRWLSDSAYWLYLVHLPLVLLAQWWVRDWPLGATVKFVLITSLIVALSLLSYQTLVRYTWLGSLLNGPRPRPGRQAHPRAARS
ncbi:MAG: acyltransferase family protein [Verrucomicrobiales bacterium]|nr:acyltransferase family protein [Verrucomicrobiales bacterium]